MGWASIIAALIQLFGPALVEWLQKWLDGILKRAAESLPDVTTYAAEPLAREALFDRAIALTPRFAFARRTLLRRLKTSAILHGYPEAVGHLTPDELAEVRDAAFAAADE